jgi:ubiquinol oxidase
MELSTSTVLSLNPATVNRRGVSFRSLNPSPSQLRCAPLSTGTRRRSSRRAQLKVKATAATDQEAPADAATTTNGRPKLIGYNYGFHADFLRTGPSVPHNAFKLAFENFGREYLALRRNLLFEEVGEIPKDASPTRKAASYIGRFALFFLRGVDKLLTLYDALPEVKPADALAEEGEELRKKLQELTLSNEGVYEREHSHPPVPAPGWIMVPYYVLCFMLDVIFNNRPIQRFWFLETVARMPYFSYISMLHLYETLGWWRVGAEVRKVHFAEEWNEMNHLKIMESLGGDRLWIDRFFAQHAAFFYYWILNFMFLVSPRVAYNFSELIETHAVDTYAQFVDENEALLKTLPPPPVALNYYLNEDLYMFDEFQTSRAPESRRPKVENLYDVFCNIRDDESEHVKTMWACQQLDYRVTSPHTSGQQDIPQLENLRSLESSKGQAARN